MKKATSSEEQRSQAHGDSTTGIGETVPAIIPFDYQGQPVRFNLDGWINATEAAKRFGKRPAHWLELPSTKSYMSALAKHLGVSFDVGKSGIKLVETSRIRGQAGTWLNPKLAVPFARWLSDDFAVWCDLHIDALLSSDPAIRRGYGVATQRLEDRKKKASKDGSSLAHFRWDKPSLVEGVTYWKEQLQLTLGLEDATNESRQ